MRINYDTYLQSPEWAVRRDAAKARAGYRCQLCNSNQNLEVHHRTYARLGHEDPGDLTVLCGACHGKFHDKIAAVGAISRLSRAMAGARITRVGRVDPKPLQSLLANCPDLAAAWRHQRNPRWTLRQYDLSIANYAAQAGWTDQQIADLVAHHRNLWDPDGTADDASKHRLDYLSHVVARVRGSST